MPETVGSYQTPTFTTPGTGAALSSEVVRNNLNAGRSAANQHDADPGVHVQGSSLLSRPAPGVAGRKWWTTDGKRLYRDTGTAWEEIAYLPSVGGEVDGNLVVTGTLNVTGGISGPIDGTEVTDLNADNLATGTVPDGRFPATLPALNGSLLTNLNGAEVDGLTAAQVDPGTYPSGPFTYPDRVTAGGFTSTGVDVGTKTTGTASSATYAIPRTTSYHRVLLQHTSAVSLTLGTGATGEVFIIEVLQGTTPQSYSFSGTGGASIRYPNTIAPPGTVVANRKDVWGALYTSASEIIMWLVVANTDSLA